MRTFYYNDVLGDLRTHVYFPLTWYSNFFMKTTQDFQQERLTQGQKIGLINLGCARNTVDSQVILGQLKKKGHRIVDTQLADTVIVNTCSFIEEARKESIDTILDLIELKKEGKIKKVVVAGCLAQRYGKDLLEEFGEVDALIGTPTLNPHQMHDQVSLTPKHFAYVKICESCFNACSFCAIPKIKGKFVSRTIESIVNQIKRLDDQGVKEINIIGQDITAYGMDLYRDFSLARLLKEIVKVCDNIQWIRLLYAFPAHVTDELIEVMAREPKICKYIDIPLQHLSDRILKEQNRNITTEGTYTLFHKIKKAMPDAFLRTTFIVGLPGETDDEFNELLEFMKTFRFERAGAFVYSKEEGTAAFDLPNHIDGRTKKKRLNQLMATQQTIARDVQAAFVGRTLRVMIDEKSETEKDVYIGRSEYDAPEVDGLVYVHSSKKLKPGDFVEVNITDALEYDLIAELRC